MLHSPVWTDYDNRLKEIFDFYLKVNPVSLLHEFTNSFTYIILDLQTLMEHQGDQTKWGQIATRYTNQSLKARIEKVCEVLKIEQQQHWRLKRSTGFEALLQDIRQIPEKAPKVKEFFAKLTAGNYE